MKGYLPIADVMIGNARASFCSRLLTPCHSVGVVPRIRAACACSKMSFNDRKRRLRTGRNGFDSRWGYHVLMGLQTVMITHFVHFLRVRRFLNTGLYRYTQRNENSVRVRFAAGFHHREVMPAASFARGISRAKPLASLASRLARASKAERLPNPTIQPGCCKGPDSVE